MIAVIESRQLCQAFLIRHAKGFAQGLYIRFHLRSKLCLADAADGRILVEHADIVEFVELAEDAELRKLGDTRDETELQVWVEHFQRTVEVLHDAAKQLQVLFFMHHVQQRGVVFINDDHHLFARLLVSFLHQVFQAKVCVHLMSLVSPKRLLLLKHVSQISFQLLHTHVLGTAEVEMKHRMLHPFLLVISNSQSFEKFFSSLEIGLKGRGKERLAESSWTIQKDELHTFLSKFRDVLGLIYIEITFLAYLRECLYSYRIFVDYFCHIPLALHFALLSYEEKLNYSSIYSIFKLKSRGNVAFLPQSQVSTCHDRKLSSGPEISYHQA